MAGCLVKLGRFSLEYRRVRFSGLAYRNPVLTCGCEDDFSWLRREPDDGLRQ